MTALKSVYKQLWAEVINTAVYHQSHSMSVWKSKTLIEVCFGKRPNLSNLCVVGSKVFARIDKAKRQKLNEKGFPCLPVGYSIMTKGYRVIDSITSTLVVVRTAAFEESNKIKYAQVVDGHLGETYSTRIDREHDEDVQIDNTVRRIHVDVEMEESHEPSSSQLDVVTTHNMDMEIEDSAVTDHFPNTAMVPRGRRYDDEDHNRGTHSGRHNLLGNPQLALMNGGLSDPIVSYESD